jgi:prolyl-tRNA synthetase
VLRWEKRTRLFLRTMEFLWQEGHTAHATAEEAQEETLKILEVYRRFAEEWMAVPVLTGVKTAQEKFAGAVNTYAIEAMVQDKRALQAGTSHFLGQNFAKAFDVTFQTADGGLDHVWATSWGVSTRLIGALIMTHSDDSGLVIPPKLAPIETVIIPIFKNKNKDEVISYARGIHEKLRAEFRTEFDDDDTQSPGYKFTQWELYGVPVRVECGPRDMENNKVVVVRRDTGEKTPVPADGVVDAVRDLLADIQSSLFERARAFREDNTRHFDGDYDAFCAFLNEPGGFAVAPWSGTTESELKVKADTKATIRVLRFGNEEEAAGKTCIVTGEPAKHIAVFARAY